MRRHIVSSWFNTKQQHKLFLLRCYVNSAHLIYKYICISVKIFKYVGLINNTHQLVDIMGFLSNGFMKNWKDTTTTKIKFSELHKLSKNIPTTSSFVT